MRTGIVGVNTGNSDLPDSSSLESLKHAAAHNDPTAAKATASQFERLFAEQLVKSMRQTSMGDSMFPGSAQTYRELYDKEIAKQLTQGKGLGLQPMIRKALGDTGAKTATPSASQTAPALLKHNAAASYSLAKYWHAAPPMQDTDATQAAASRTSSSTLPASSVLPTTQSTDSATGVIASALLGADRIAAGLTPATAAVANPAPAGIGSVSSPSFVAAHRLLGMSSKSLDSSIGSGRATPTGSDAPLSPPTSTSAPNRSFSQDQFVNTVWPHAQRAAAALGVTPEALVAQAALESNWGRSVGGNHNLFGIKAGSNWTGATKTLQTSEYSNGAMHRESATFRSYASVGDSFDDYVNLLKSNPRYAAALNSGNDTTRFASALQKAGYATDPSYAAKITSIARGPVLTAALQKSGSVPLLASR